MITGFNTDVDYDGRIFHVQTEDKGRDNPVLDRPVHRAPEDLDRPGIGSDDFF